MLSIDVILDKSMSCISESAKHINGIAVTFLDNRILTVFDPKNAPSPKYITVSGICISSASHLSNELLSICVTPSGITTSPLYPSPIYLTSSTRSPDFTILKEYALLSSTLTDLPLLYISFTKDVGDINTLLLNSMLSL